MFEQENFFMTVESNNVISIDHFQHIKVQLGSEA